MRHALLVALALVWGAGCKKSPRHAGPAAPTPDAGPLVLARGPAAIDAGTEVEAAAEEPWAGDTFVDAPESSDDEVTRWESFDRNHREFWFGLWHASPYVSDGFNDRIGFYPDGRFIVRSDQYRCGDGLTAAQGTWTLERGVLVLVSTWRDRLVGSTCDDEDETKGGTTQNEHDPVTHRLRVEACRRKDWEGEDPEGRTCLRLLEPPGPPGLLVGHGGPFWRIGRTIQPEFD